MEIATNMQIHLQFKSEATEADTLAYASEFAETLDYLEQPWLIGEPSNNMLIVWVNVSALEAVLVPASPSLDYVRIFRHTCCVASNQPLISSGSN